MSSTEQGQSSSFDSQTGLSCESCIGACCREGVRLPLTKKEASYMRQAGAGTVLRKMVADEVPRSLKPRSGKSYYLLETDCGNLDPETFQCQDYENRPEVCRNFKAGTILCDAMFDRQKAVVSLGMPTFPTETAAG